jgi:D-alanyl-D-alanine carboxypeptidase/D-alanyl-D-alanine-endopeptidase (penicillin-binding protein 4)
VRFSRAAALAVAIVLVAGAAGGYAVHRHRDHTVTPVAVKQPTPLPSAPTPRDPVLPILDPAAVHPTKNGVQAALRRPADSVSRGAHLVGEVIDARSGDKLWAQNPTQAQPPASTTKLLTAAASLSRLGPDFRLSTTTRRVGHTIYLVGGGDPTIVEDNSSYDAHEYPKPATLADLAEQTVGTLGKVDAVHLRLDASTWGGSALAPGWKPTYITEGDITPPSSLEVDEGRLNPASEGAARSESPAAQAGNAFAELLRRDGIRVIGKPSEAAAPPTATLTGTVYSAPLAELVQRMLTLSDDDLAEALGRAVARHDHKPATFAGAARAVTDAVHTLGVPTSGVALKDTSGLSHQDRIPPRTLVSVLRAAVSPTHPQLRPMLGGLPVAGLTGTLANRYLDKPSSLAAGVLRAQTGVVVDRSGRLLIFAFLASNAISPGLTVPAIDRLAAQLERCGCDRA